MTARKRGRPPKAAQTLDAALEAAHAGTGPRRPRNQFERDAQRGKRGRKQQPLSATRQAAQLARDLAVHEGVKPSAAAQRAADVFGVSPGGVRRYVCEMFALPMVEVPYRGAATWAPIGPKELPLLFGTADVNDEFPADFGSKTP